MPFSDFHGNSEILQRMRDMLARKRLPHAVILAGPHGSGKYTLALMLAKTMNCVAPTVTDGLPDFFVEGANGTRIAQSEGLVSRCSEAVETREHLRETEQKEMRIA